MKFQYGLKRLYYENSVYIFFGIVQLALAFTLMFYLMMDFKQHFREQIVLEMEILIFTLMLFDCIAYHYVHGFTFRFISVLEFTCLLSFVGCFVAVYFHGVQISDEEVEFVLIVVRSTVQVLRFFTLIGRIHENREEQKLNTPIEILENGNSSIKEVSSEGQIQINLS